MKNVIFFDGECGLCNGFIDFVMKIDKDHIFFFSPLQSEYAHTHLPKEFTKDLKTVIVQTDDGHTHKKSIAVFSVFQKIGGTWSIVSLLRFLPLVILNGGYDLVASNRYSLFGKKETCRLPTIEERRRFIL